MRSFELQTKPWARGLEIQILEGGVEVGFTQTEGSRARTQGAILDSVDHYLHLNFGLTDDEYTLTIRD